MHHKFCVIDHRIVITGSYNWTNNAEKNDENIVIVEDYTLALEYADAFLALLSNSEPLCDDDAWDGSYFMATKAVVDAQVPFELMWMINHVHWVQIQPHVGLQASRGQTSMKIQESTSFVLEAYNTDTLQQIRQVVHVECIPDLVFQAQFQVQGYGDIPAEKCRLNDNTFVLPLGAHVRIDWQCKGGDEVYIQNSSGKIQRFDRATQSQGLVLAPEVERSEGGMKGSFVLDHPRGIERYELWAKNRVRHSKKINLTVQRIEMPKLDKITLPFPPEINSFALVEMMPTRVPASFQLSDIPIRFDVPSLLNLQHGLVEEPPKGYPSDSRFAKYQTALPLTNALQQTVERLKVQSSFDSLKGMIDELLLKLKEGETDKKP
jgi:hypothetical protein